MPEIKELDQQTIDKIAAGEVIDRPASVVKELVENAIDAQSTAITVEIKEGGISLIRITDNGCGIDREQVPLAFLRHTTSKIRQVEDLLTVSSLGFRGEALSSIAAVAQVELITKTPVGLSGVRYLIEGSKEQSLEEIGAPEGTTFLVRNLFYNTPARKKFLKSASTEAGYISGLMEHLALSHPQVSFKFIVNNQVKLHTSGNSNLKEIIYHIYGREIAGNLLPIKKDFGWFSVEGFLGKPLISRGNRNYETYFINGRYIRSTLISKSIEDGYKSFVMQHKYPFTVLHISIQGELLDVNVHPSKMELRFQNQEQLYEQLRNAIRETINEGELVYQVALEEANKKDQKDHGVSPGSIPEPFERNRLQVVREAVGKDSPYQPKYDRTLVAETRAGYGRKVDKPAEQPAQSVKQPARPVEQPNQPVEQPTHLMEQSESGEQLSLELPVETGTAIEPQQNQRRFLDPASIPDHQIIGQIFDTYWLVQLDDKLYIIDQHAAHEKVLYQRAMKALEEKEHTSQMIFPPMLLSLSMQEESLLKKYQNYFTKIGFQWEHFGGKEYAVTAVPDNLYGIKEQELLVEMLDSLAQLKGNETPQLILEKIASMSCKAAVKGNQRLSKAEAQELIAELLTLENPYHCPHGRPTIISMTKHELEKKFKRVL